MRLFMSLVENALNPAEQWTAACDAMTEFRGKVFVGLNEVDETTAEIEDISAAEMGQGWGTKAMTAFCAKADELGVTIVLAVANETDGGAFADEDYPDEDTLVEWYSRFGFEVTYGALWDERTRMKRTPA